MKKRKYHDQIIKFLRTAFRNGLKKVSKNEKKNIALVHIGYDEFIDFLFSVGIDVPIAIRQYVKLGVICETEEENAITRQCTRSFYVTPKVMQPDVANLISEVER